MKKDKEKNYYLKDSALVSVDDDFLDIKMWQII